MAVPASGETACPGMVSMDLNLGGMARSASLPPADAKDLATPPAGPKAASTGQAFERQWPAHCRMAIAALWSSYWYMVVAAEGLLRGTGHGGRHRRGQLHPGSYGVDWSRL